MRYVMARGKPLCAPWTMRCLRRGSDRRIVSGPLAERKMAYFQHRSVGTSALMKTRLRGCPSLQDITSTSKEYSYRRFPRPTRFSDFDA